MKDPTFDSSRKSDEFEPTPRVCCGVKVTKKIEALALSFVLFTTIATAQLVGALIANSLALLSDTSSMFLDAATYAINIYAEAQPKEDKRKTQKTMLIASGVSFLALLGITLYFLIDAISVIQSGETGDDDVNPYIVLGFAVAGIVFDLASLLPYMLRGLTQGDHADEAGRMNMCSALSHVLSDTARSITTLIESFVIIFGNVNGTKADAYSAMIVSCIIIVGVAKSLHQWSLDAMKFANGEELDDDADGLENFAADEEAKRGSVTNGTSEVGTVEA